MTDATAPPAIDIPVIIPELGTGTMVPRISAWYVEPGDAVEPGEPVLEVMIPGVTCDIGAPAGGTVARLVAVLDTAVAPGTIVAWLTPRA